MSTIKPTIDRKIVVFKTKAAIAEHEVIKQSIIINENRMIYFFIVY